MAKSPIAVPYDSSGVEKATAANPLRTDPTGTTAQPVSDAGGSLTVDATSLPLPTGAATEVTLAGVKTGTDKIPTDPAREGGNLATLAAVDFATQTTLASVLAKLDITLSALRDAIVGVGPKTLTDVETTLDAIKDTDGIKKITDQLPAGTNNIGAIDAWAHDGTGNEIASVVIETIRRLEQRGVITSPDGTKDVDVILDTGNDNVNRLQTESLLAPGSQVNIGTGVPSNPSDLVIDFCKNGGSEDMLVNGSATPVNFDFGPSGSDIYALEELLLVFSADDFEFDGASFGPNSLLTNGILIQTIIGSTPVTTTLATVVQNEDFLRLPGRTPLVNNTGPKDIMAVNLIFGGSVKLSGVNGDIVRIKIQDNLTSVKFKYLTGTAYAVKES